MGIELRANSKWWYGRWMRNGKRHFTCLNVESVGKPGDKAFEESKKRAFVAFDKAVADFDQQRRPEDLVQEIHRVKFGHRIGSILITRLFDEWSKIPRRRHPKLPYVKWAKRTFQRLTDFIKAEFPKVKEMAAVDKKVAEAFMRHEDLRGVSPKTYNAELILLRGAFEHLREDAGMLTNPFGRIVTKDRETIHRKPFSPDELKAIIESARKTPLIYPLIVTGVCTAMRRGDACLLKWDSVDLKQNYITVKTSKTGETVDIPMLPLLRGVFAKYPVRKGGYVFPELAAMYLKNPSGVDYRLTKVFEQAGFIDESEIKRRNKGRKKAGMPELDIDHKCDVHVDRENGGLRSANVRGFHSLRVTWITLALAAGVPMELVRRVTGHKTADVVLKNYFKPGREDFRQAIEGAMPKMLTGYDKAIDVVPEEGAGDDAADSLEQALRLLKGVTGKANKKRVTEVMKLIRAAKAAAKL